MVEQVLTIDMDTWKIFFFQYILRLFVSDTQSVQVKVSVEWCIHSLHVDKIHCTWFLIHNADAIHFSISTLHVYDHYMSMRIY